MGSIMDQERPWERDPENWDKPRTKEPECEHEWKFEFASLDYDHYKCTKCGKGSLR